MEGWFLKSCRLRRRHAAGVEPHLGLDPGDVGKRGRIVVAECVVDVAAAGDDDDRRTSRIAAASVQAEADNEAVGETVQHGAARILPIQEPTARVHDAWGANGGVAGGHGGRLNRDRIG
ncbi:hypothetical protein PG988_003190 [Apiospora saccharicola]